MRVCGIIAEYDPFHNGHLYHLEQARKLSKADYVVCVISTAFTQRGLPSLFSTHDRTRMALEGGADLVLGMPVFWSCAQANRFALGGTGILNALGVVTHLAFGVEEGNLGLLDSAASMLRRPAPVYRETLQASLARGESLARAQGVALAAALCESAGKALNSPNFNLGLAYLEALGTLHSAMQPLPIARRGSYHDTSVQPFPSATAVRAALLRGGWASAAEALPKESLKIIRACALEGRMHLPDALDSPLLARLLAGGDFSAIDEISEGLDSRILKLAPQAADREHLISLVKTKRYPYARISRALSHCLLGMERQPLSPPPYARLLGLRKGSAPLLREISRGDFPLITRPARQPSASMALDMRAEELWRIGAGRPAAEAWRQKTIVI